MIRNIAARHGSLTQLAARLGVNPAILTRQRRPSAGLAVALARELRLSLDAIFSGQLASVGKCSACGARKGGAS